VDGGMPSRPRKKTRKRKANTAPAKRIAVHPSEARIQFWGAAKFAFHPMTQNIYGEPAEPSKMPYWVDFG